MILQLILLPTLFALNSQAQTVPKAISVGECQFNRPRHYYDETYSYSVQSPCKLFADAPYTVTQGYFEASDATFPSAVDVQHFKHASGFVLKRLMFYSSVGDLKEAAVAAPSENACGIKATRSSYLTFKKGDELNPWTVSDLAESIFVGGQEVAYKGEDIAFIKRNGKTYISKSIYSSSIGYCRTTPAYCYAVAEWSCK